MKVSTIRTSRDRRYLGTDLVGSQDSAGGGSGMSGSLGSVLSGAHSVRPYRSRARLPIEVTTKKMLGQLHFTTKITYTTLSNGVYTTPKSQANNTIHDDYRYTPILRYPTPLPLPQTQQPTPPATPKAESPAISHTAGPKYGSWTERIALILHSR